MSDYIAYSLLIMTDTPQISCTTCGHKKAWASFVKDGPKKTLLKTCCDCRTKVRFTLLKAFTIIYYYRLPNVI